MDMTTDMNNYDEGLGLRWQSSAILALQEATEAYLVHLFEDACVHIVNLYPRFKNLTQLFIQQSLCNSRETSDHHATRHPTCTADSWTLDRLCIVLSRSFLFVLAVLLASCFVSSLATFTPYLTIYLLFYPLLHELKRTQHCTHILPFSSRHLTPPISACEIPFTSVHVQNQRLHWLDSRSQDAKLQESKRYVDNLNAAMYTEGDRTRGPEQVREGRDKWKEDNASTTSRTTGLSCSDYDYRP